MYKHLIAVIMLMLAFISGPSVVSAQQSVDDSTYNQAPSSNTSNQTSGTSEDRGGFNWRWLLPLLAVPFFFLLKRDDKEEDRSQYRDRRFAGSKGGETKRERDDAL